MHYKNPFAYDQRIDNDSLMVIYNEHGDTVMPRQITKPTSTLMPDINMILRNPFFILVHLLFILTCLMGALLTNASAAFQHVPIVATAAAGQDAQAISDMFIFLWSAGGSLIGAYIGTAQAVLGSGDKTVPMPGEKDVKRNAKIAMAFSVSLLLGVLITPAVVTLDWIPDQWQFIFVIGGLVSYGAWAILYIVNKIYGHFMKRADKEGLAGVLDEAKKRI